MPNIPASTGARGVTGTMAVEGEEGRGIDGVPVRAVVDEPVRVELGGGMGVSTAEAGGGGPGGVFVPPPAAPEGLNVGGRRRAAAGANIGLASRECFGRVEVDRGRARRTAPERVAKLADVTEELV